MLQVGSTVDGWHIDAVIHQGSMAVTYAVSHEDHPRAYAMKVLYLQDPGFQERLRRAGEALRTIRHPHLLPIVDVVDIQGSTAVVSDFVEGTDLAGWCADPDHSLADRIQLFRKLCKGLQAAHKHGLVHRNLKPAKVLVDVTDHPYIHDFMLGKVLSGPNDKAVTQMGTTFGTPQYMAPEQFRGAGEVDERADVFSMGALLFEMVTGRRAFDGTGLMEIYKQVASEDRPKVHDLNPDTPPALEALVADLLAPDPDDRVPTIRDLITRMDTDADLRSLVNPSFRTATPVSALTSDRPVKRAVTLDPPTREQGPPNVVAVTPVAGPREDAPPREPVHQGHAGPSLTQRGPDPVGDLLSDSSDFSQDSRPSLVTFTDGSSQESAVAELQLQRLDSAPPPPPRPAPPGVSTAKLVGGLALLFVVAMGIGLLAASF